ncbi:MAG: hypothetical protein VSS75_006045, partial [Candidatus Parabeggiatoa sp.]|nr:hypothetical protein [Candidatus Parabeggiatoa sp.]
MKSFRKIGLVMGLMVFSLTVAAAQNDPGQAYFNRGNFELAAQYWHEALSNENNSKRYIDTSVRLSAAYVSLGRLKEAFRVLETALPVADKIDDPVRQASVLMQFSDVYLAMRDFQENRMDCGMKKITQDIIPFLEEETLTPKGMINEALYYLEESEKAATKIDPEKKKYPLLWANILNREGNIQLLEAFRLYELGGDYEEKANNVFKNIYQESIDLAERKVEVQVDAQVLKAKMLINRFSGYVQLEEYTDEIQKELKNQNIYRQVEKLPNSHDKAFAFISLAQLMLTNASSSQINEKLRGYIYYTLIKAIEIAEELGDNSAIAYAKFYLAQLYEEEAKHENEKRQKAKLYDKAISLTREAIFYIQNYPRLHTKLQKELWGYPELLFRLEWHLGNVLKAQKHDHPQKTTIADAYEHAHKHLQLVRKGYGSLSQAFLKEAKQFYFDWADFLLQQASKISDASEKQEQLKEAIKVVEWFEAAEVRDYFRDDCITRRLEEKVQHLDDNL